MNCSKAQLLLHAVPSSRRQVPLYDLQNNFHFTCSGQKTLCFRGILTEGLYLLEAVTKVGTFDTDSLMLPLQEWPTLRTVPSGPFDFDHTQFTMTVPTFRFYVDNHDHGLVWCEVPNPDDMNAARVRAAWGIKVTESGMHELKLKIPADEQRLRIADIAQLQLRADTRYEIATPLTCKGRPGLLLTPAKLAALRTEPDEWQQRMLDELTQQLQSGRDETYGHRTVTAALMGLVTDNQEWLDEAVSRALAICERPHWGYHDVPEIMGWNNDRDTGMRMFEVALVYDWLHDRLNSEQRQIMRQKLIYQAELAEKITRLQYGYWYNKIPEAHGQGYWFGFAAAAFALHEEETRAQEWLDWTHGNVHDALKHMPPDGIIEWLVFNVQWLLMTAQLLEYGMARKLQGTLPCLRGFADNMPHYLGKDQHARHPGGVVPLLLFYLADRFDDAQIQGNAIKQLEAALALDRGTGSLHPFTVLAYNPLCKPATPVASARAYCSLSGNVFCQEDTGKTTFNFRCGTPLTSQLHDLHNWNAQIWYNPQHSGSFSWHVDGVEVVPLTLPSYRKRTRHSNLITIDGGGHWQGSRWLSGGIPVWRTSHIEQFTRREGIVFCHGDNSFAYRDECEVDLMYRRWIFFEHAGIAVMHDRVLLRSPHHCGWVCHSRGHWEEADALQFAAVHDGRRVAFSLHPLKAPKSDGISVQIQPSEYVPPYSCGLNSYKTRAWQPEVHARHRQPPDFSELTFATDIPVSQFELVTIMGGDSDRVFAAELSEESGAVHVTIPTVADLYWNSDGPLCLPGQEKAEIAEVVVLKADANGPIQVNFQPRDFPE